MICYFPTARKGIISYLCTLCVATSQKYQHYEQSILRRGGVRFLIIRRWGAWGLLAKANSATLGHIKLLLVDLQVFCGAAPN